MFRVAYIDEGTFEERVLKIISGVTLLGKSKDKTIIKGSIEVYVGANAALKNLTISNDGSSPAIYCNNSNPLINKVTINGASTGIRIYASKPHILEVTVTNCSTGIVDWNDATPLIESSSIYDCLGQGIYAYGSAKPTIQNAAISGCEASGVYCSRANAIVETSTITK